MQGKAAWKSKGKGDSRASLAVVKESKGWTVDILLSRLEIKIQRKAQFKEKSGRRMDTGLQQTKSGT